MLTGRKVIDFELKGVDEARGTFQGYGSTFGNVDHGGDRVMTGAFKESLAEHRAKSQLPAMFWMHDWKVMPGEWVSMGEDGKGLEVDGALWVEGNQVGAKPLEVAEMVRNMLNSKNSPKGLSIGYDILEHDFVTEGKGEDKRTIRQLKRLELFEVSPVPFGMNAEATVTDAKRLMLSGVLPESKRELEKILRHDAGFSKKNAMALISGGWSALMRDAENDPEVLEALKDLSKTFKGE